MKFRQCIFAIIFFLIYQQSANAQLNADFTADITSGCDQLIVQFTNLSTGSGLSYEWFFGNSNSSILKDPSASYTTPGSYDVTLIITDGANNDTIVKYGYIKVWENPTSDFETLHDTQGCNPYTVSFNDLSQIGDGIITQWLWDFGDGNISLVKDPVHTFNSANIYSISLLITDIHGCSDITTITNYIHVIETPKADFVTDIRESCKNPMNVKFTDSSKSISALTYFWDLGDGITSTSQNPTHSYVNYGKYSVKLIVSNVAGCKDTILKTNFINVTKVEAIFDLIDSICPKEDLFLHISNTSIGADSYLWNFGNGSISHRFVPNYAYDTPGTYLVTLQVFGTDSSCTDTDSTYIFVDSVSADFTVNPNYSCFVPFPVNFTDQSSYATSWTWDFGDGSTSTDKNPYHAYLQEGVFRVTLTVISELGCVDTFIKDSAVVIILPKADFYADTIKGCAPLKVDFSDTSFSNEPISSWNWNFGDGTTSNLKDPSHTYTQDTTYTVQLIIINQLGCRDTFELLIDVGQKPVVDFVVDPDTVCAVDTVFFTDSSSNSAGPDKNNEWFWSFGDGGSSTIQSPFYNYVDTGYQMVTLIVGYNGCYDTLEKDSFVYIYGPIVSLNTQLDCANPYDYLILANIISANQWNIDFDHDGVYDYISPFYPKDTSLIEVHPYTFPSRGTHIVTINAINDSCINGTDPCTYSDSISLIVADLKAKFDVPDSLACARVNDTFNATDTQDVYQYYWDYGDGIQDTGGPGTVHAYDYSGTYNIALIVEDINGCTKTLYHPIYVYDLMAKFEADTIIECADHLFKFTDKSVGDTTISDWSWDFGNGDNTSQQNPDYVFNEADTFIVILTIKDVLGCVSDYFNYIFTNQPYVEFYSIDSQICVGKKIYFVNQSEGNYPSFQWDFGDGSTSSAMHPNHTFNDSGYFSITLKVTDMHGCSVTKTKEDFIKVHAEPIPGFFADTTLSYCYPFLVTFKDTSISDHIASWEWNFGDNTVTNTPREVKHLYLERGSYDVRLIVTTAFGCRDTILKKDYIQVGGPIADFSIFPDTACRGEEITFVMSNDIDVYNFNWDFGDGNVITGTNKTTTHIYNKNGIIYPKLLYSDSLDICKKSIKETLYIYYLKADYVMNDSIGEVPLAVAFRDTSVNATSWYWNFDDGQDTTLQHPHHDFTEVGEYHVELIVMDTNGCSDTIIRIVQVIPKPFVIDLPNAFTPNNDGFNDIVFLYGHKSRFKELLEFKIYNRWGQVVFQTLNPDEGWDGTYQDKPQNSDTYLYVVKVKDFEDNTIAKSGYINLLR